MTVSRRRLILGLAAGIHPWGIRAKQPDFLAGWTIAGLATPLNWQPVSSGVSPSQPWLYLDFWASWCGPCRLSFPWMNQAQARWGAQRLRVVAVTVDRRREDAERFLKANPASFEIGFDPDGALARREAVRTMPTSLLVAPDGSIRHRHAGFTAASGAELDAVLQRLLGA